MRLVTLAAADDFDGWRAAMRGLIQEGVPADQVSWRVGDALPDLFGVEPERAPAPVAGALSVPRAFVDLAKTVILHADVQRFARLHRMLIRLRERPGMMADAADPELRRLHDMAKAVRRDIHKMRAFLRFREIDGGDGDGPRYVAWFEPEHHIVRRNAAFFLDRFAAMRWSILTPDLSIHWDGARLLEGPGADRRDAPDEDAAERLWTRYYSAIFNPARIKIGAMMKEMPRKYWKNMPETALIPQLIAGAQQREAAMVTRASARVHDNAGAALAALKDEAASCTRCPLHQQACRTVFGEGPVDAPLMFVGEQPGDQEDQAGRPFVGPAGQLFDRALGDAGIDRSAAYVTNAVKHFKFEARGKRRIHARPNAGEIMACRWWIDQERAIVKPRLTVALGATATHSLFGKAMPIGPLRGRALRLPGEAGELLTTVHPSYLLRLPDEQARSTEYARFVADLAAIAAHLRG